MAIRCQFYDNNIPHLFIIFQTLTPYHMDKKIIHHYSRTEEHTSSSQCPQGSE